MTETTMRYFPAIDDGQIGDLLDKWRSAWPAMGILALLPEAEREAVARLQRSCVQRRIPLAGGLFPALLVDNGFCQRGAWLLRLDEMPYVGVHSGLPRDPEKIPAAVDAIVDGLNPHLGTDRDSTLFLMFDAMLPNVATLLDELYLRLANRVRYMGVNAGSESFKPMACLFDGAQLGQDGVLAILLKSHKGAVLEHGYEAPAQTLTATSTEGNRILQIDWRPAFDVYQEMARAQYGVEINRQNFYDYAVHFPFGIVRANGVILVRIPVALEEDGSLFCVGEVPPNAVLTLLAAPAVNSTRTLETLTQGLSAIGGPVADRELLLFYCAGRRLHLGLDAAQGELRAFAQRTGAAQVAGALSLGEIGGSTPWSYPLFQNATLVACRWGREGA